METIRKNIEACEEILEYDITKFNIFFPRVFTSALVFVKDIDNQYIIFQQKVVPLFQGLFFLHFYIG